MERCPSTVAPISSERAKRRASRAGAVAAHGANSPEALTAKAELAAYGLAEHIQRIVATAPPFTPEQREKLAALLRTGAA